MGAPLMQRACWFLRGVGHSLCDGPTGKPAFPSIECPAVTGAEDSAGRFIKRVPTLPFDRTPLRRPRAGFESRQDPNPSRFTRSQASSTDQTFARLFYLGGAVAIRTSPPDGNCLAVLRYACAHFRAPSISPRAGKVRRTATIAPSILQSFMVTSFCYRRVPDHQQ